MILPRAVLTLSKFGRKVAPTACAIAGATGVVYTGYSAAKTGEEVGAYEQKFNYKLPLRQKIVIYRKPIIFGGLSIGAIILGDRLHVKRYAALSAAANIIQERARLKDVGMQQLQQDIYKQDKAEAVQAADECKAQNIWDSCEKNGIKPFDTHTGIDLWYEPISETWFLANEDHVKNVFYHINRNFARKDEITFNEFLMFLDLPHNKPGFDLLHWDHYEGETIYGYQWIDFMIRDDLTLRDGTKYKAIFYPFEPHLSEK